MQRSSFALTDFARVLARRKWVVLATIAVAVAAMAGLSRSQDERYASTATVALAQQAAPAILGQARNAGDQDRTLLTLATMAETRDVAVRALEDAGVDRAPVELLDASSVTVQPNTDLLQFRVEDADPDVARRLAGAYANAFAELQRNSDLEDAKNYAKALSDQLDVLEKEKAAADRAVASLIQRRYATAQRNLQEIQSFLALAGTPYIASTADQAVKTQPRTMRNLAIGALVGLVLGIALAFLLDPLDTRIHSPEEVVEDIELPVLGRIPRARRSVVRAEQLVLAAEPASAHAEAIRILRARLDVALPPDARTIMVTSAVPNEGKSTTVGNLALAYADAGRDVVLVDLDLGRPSMHRYLNVPPAPGVVEVLEGRVLLADALHEVPPAGAVASNGSVNSNVNGSRRSVAAGRLRVLTAGTLSGDPARLLSSRALDDMLAELGETALVLVDSAPVLAVSHAVILGTKVDAILAVARAEALDRGELDVFIETLNALPTRKLGVALTGVSATRTYAAYYGSPSGAAAGPSK
jgi:Mrp family chromosome partitioning ATPase/capsular polysaccharide biosynthesis protein